MKKSILTALFTAALLCGGLFWGKLQQPSAACIRFLAESVMTSPAKQGKKAIHYNEFLNRDQSTGHQNTSRVEAAPCPPRIAACRYFDSPQSESEKQSVPRSLQAANPGEIRAGPLS